MTGQQEADIAINLVRDIVSELEGYFDITFSDTTDQDSLNYLRCVFYFAPGECLEISAPVGGIPCIIHNQAKNNKVPIGSEDQYLKGFRERLFEFLIRIRKLHQF